MNRKDDKAVEEALFKRACGYNVEEVAEEDSEKYGKKRKTTLYHIPGDVRAQIFWLRNRRPQQWKDKPGEEDKKQEGGVQVLDDVP